MADTCCPYGTTYIDNNGNFSDPLLGSGTIANPNASSFYGTCVTLNHTNNNTIWAIATGKSTIPCPCCPDGYTYSNSHALCVGSRNQTSPPIPCITCVCITPPPPPPCPTCNGGLAISFSFNSFARTCVECTPQDFQLTNDPKLNAFLPYFLIQPNNQDFKLY